MIGSRINKIAVSDAGRAIEYRADYAEAVASGIEDYLARGLAPSFWCGSGAASARLAGPVELEAAKLLFAARDPITGSPLGRFTPQTGALELSIAPPKSVSVLAALAAALGDVRVNRIIDEALDAAAAAAVATAEDLGAHRTRSHTGSGPDRRMVWHHSDGLIAAVYAHETNHNGDPQKHRHIAIANRVCRADGHWASIDTRALFGAKGAMVAVAGAVFNQRLVEQLGATLDEAGEIAGVPLELVELFSSRHDEIQSALAEWAQRHEDGGHALSANQIKDAAERFATTTRSGPKVEHETPEQRWGRWLAEACAALGVGPGDIDLSAPPDAVASQRYRLAAWAWPPDGAPPAAVQEARAALDEIMAGRAVWRRRQVLTEAAKLVPAGADARWAHWLCDDATARSVTIIEVPPLPPDAPLGETVDPNAAVYQSPAVWHAEHEIMAAADAGADTACAVAAGFDGWDANLSGDQAAAVEDVCSSGDTISVVVGAAGTGKTTMMRAAAARWADAGYKVTGVAVAARAGAILRDEAGLDESRTVAGMLRGKAGPPPPGVWIIDEAGMVSTIDLAAVIEAAARTGSKVVMVGDPRQLPAIGAGGMYRLLAERHGAAQLDTGWRFSQEWEFPNSKRLAVGDHAAIDTLSARGRVHDVPDWAHTVAHVSAHHEFALQTGQTFVATARTRAEVHALNIALRGQLDLGPELVRLHRGDRDAATPIAAGDIIVTGRNSPGLTDSAGEPVLNGDRWRVLGLQRDQLHVERLDAPAITAQLPADYLQGANPDGRPWVEHAIATTVHRAQGVTVDHSVAVANAGSTRNQLNVQATRGRNANHLIVTAHDHPDALAVLYGALDQLSDDITGIEHAETLAAAAAARPSAPPPPAVRDAAAPDHAASQDSPTGDEAPIDALEAAAASYAADAIDEDLDADLLAAADTHIPLIDEPQPSQAPQEAHEPPRQPEPAPPAPQPAPPSDEDLQQLRRRLDRYAGEALVAEYAERARRDELDRALHEHAAADERRAAVAAELDAARTDADRRRRVPAQLRDRIARLSAAMTQTEARLARAVAAVTNGRILLAGAEADKARADERRESALRDLQDAQALVPEPEPTGPDIEDWGPPVL